MEHFDIRLVRGRTFRSGPLAMTDIHNAGSILGVVYYEVLHFDDLGAVSLENRVVVDKAGGIGWTESIRDRKWTGSYSFDRDGKHVKCSMRDSASDRSKVIYADFASADMLIAEVYDDGKDHGRGQVFTSA